MAELPGQGGERSLREHRGAAADHRSLADRHFLELELGDRLQRPARSGDQLGPGPVARQESDPRGPHLGIMTWSRASTRP